MITVESVDVARAPESLLGCSLDAPTAGFSVDGHVLRIVGWALASEGPLVSVEIGGMGLGALAQGALVRKRPDLEAAYPNILHAGMCGFDVLVPLVGLPPSFSLWIIVVGEDGKRHHIGSLTAQRSKLSLPMTSGPSPVMITTLGRTGSTWLTQLLAEHPAIIALEPFRLEPRIVGYWAEICRALVKPSSYLAPLLSTEPETDGWWQGSRPIPGRPVDMRSFDILEQWFSDGHITDIATFCRDSVHRFYREVHQLSGLAEQPRYIVEKFMPTWVPEYSREIFPEAKELFLIRDFRDRLASVLNFNQRRGYDAFGREQFSSDEAYVRKKVLGDAVSLLRAWQSRRDRALLVRYEDLVLQPQQTTVNILEYLDLPADLTSATALREGARPAEERMATHRTTDDAAASVGRWRRDLDVSLQRTCDEVLGELLIEFGYDLASG